MLKEWESGEKAMLAGFFSFLKGLPKGSLNIHGFNVLGFDLPYLFGRMKTHNIAHEQEIHDALFSPHVIDMMQLGRLISDDTRKKEQLWGISQSEANEFFGIQTREGTGAECSRYYDAGQFDSIVECCNREFTFEQLLNSFYLYARGLMENRNS